MRPVGFNGAFADDDNFVGERGHAEAVSDSDNGDVALAGEASQSSEERGFGTAIEGGGAFVKD